MLVAIEKYLSAVESKRLAGRRHAGMVPALVAVAATIALAGYLLPSGFAADDAMMAGSPDAMSADDAAATLPEYARYDADSIDSRVQATVIEALVLYWEEGSAAFDMITPKWALRTDTIYPFVLDAETFETVAHGAFPDFAGVVSDTLTRADSSVDRILADMERDGGTWVEYMATNPASGLVQPKRSWVYLHDDYIFGAGHYLTESQIKYVVEDAIRLYESKGQAAFDIITPEEVTLVTELYPFVFNATTLTTVAHGAIPDRVGHVPYSILSTGDRSVDDILADMYRDGGTWVEYVFTNPGTDTKQLKRSWLYPYGGYIFSSGYYLQDSRVQSLVEDSIHLYRAHGTDAFGIITTEPGIDLESLLYSFVLDADTLETVAHSGLPDRVGAIDNHLNQADKRLHQIQDELDREGSSWIAYLSENPNTRTNQMVRTYLSEHDGYIFGSGYYLPDSRIQSKVDEAIYTYKSNSETAFGTISSGRLLSSDGLYPTVRNLTHMVAHGIAFAVPQVIGPISGVFADFDVQTARDARAIFGAAARGSGNTFNTFLTIDATTLTTQVKLGYGALHDGYLFSSSYTVPNADAQSVVDYAIFVYESNKENDAWIDIITPEEPILTDDLYPFVINATSWIRLADGVVPDRVGKPETILDTSARSVEDVLAELKVRGGLWATYTFHNPSTGTEQLKRTWLQLRDGLVFGSGYYVLDSQVQAIAYGQTLDYDSMGRDAAFAKINTIPRVPVSPYGFVVDPITGIVEAQNVDPNRIGNTSDWDVISSDLQVDEILEQLRTEAGTWVGYTHTNPVTGEMEGKRTWLIMHDGLIFGSGYYSLDIPEYNARLVVNKAIITYEANLNNDAWIDVITPEEPVMSDDLYPFVINATSWIRLADGVVPDRVGKPETILDTSARSVEDVLAELKVKRGVWVTYTFHNPSTDTDQLKRTWLQLRDGLVFGSGYYVLDSQVQATAYGQILEYNNKGSDAAFAEINTIPDMPVSTYGFVVDPITGIVEAQSVDSNLIGDTSDWDVISSDLQVDEILEEVATGAGTWVGYTHTNPVTGEMENKRTWLIMHDGLIFGSGYYSSD